MMKYLLTLLLGLTTISFAQNTNRLDILTKSLKKSQVASAKHDAHIRKMVVELKALDTVAEKNIDGALSFIRKYRDSKETLNRMVRNKKYTIDGLKKNLKKYAERRETAVKELATDKKYLKEDMRTLSDWLMTKIKLRIAQATEMTKSLANYREYYDFGGNHSAKRQRVHRATLEKDKVIREMRRRIEDFNKEITKLEKEISNPNAKLSLVDINRELAAKNEKIATLEESIEDIFNGGDDGEIVGRKAAIMIEKELKNKIRKAKSSQAVFFKNLDALMQALKKRRTLYDKAEGVMAEISFEKSK